LLAPKSKNRKIIEKSKKNKFFNFIFKLFIFLMPSQLAIHLWPNWTHVLGVRVDYLSIVLNLTDILLVILIGYYFFLHKQKLIKSAKKYLGVIVIVFFLFLINLLFTPYKEVTFFAWLKVFEMLVFLIFIIESEENLLFLSTKPFFVSYLSFGVIGLLQVLKNQSIGGLFWYLGERTFNLSTPLIATGSFLGKEFLRSYSVFSHPNSFAGYYLVVGVLLLRKKALKKNYKLLLVTIGTIVLLITNSKAVLITTAIILFLLPLSKKWEKLFQKLAKTLFLIAIVFSFTLPVIANKLLSERNAPKYIYERLFMADISGKIISSNFLFGVGEGAYTKALGGHTSAVNNWFIQPVHNIFLLALGELGILGLMLFLYLILKAFEKQKFKLNFLTIGLLVIIFTGSLDHYWLTLQQNRLLFTFILGLCFKDKLSVNLKNAQNKDIL